MTGKSWKSCVLFLCWIAWGCGGKATPPPQDGAQAAPASESSPPPEDSLPPPEPVAAPPGVVLRARVRNPRELAQTISDAASSPVSVRELLEKLSPELQRLFRDALDPTGPLEALVALNPVAGREPYAAWSISARGTRSVLGVLDEAQVEFREGPSGVFYFTYAGSPCALGRSRGPSPARIVCSERDEGLNALAPYMLRGLPDEALSDAAAHLEIIAAPLQETYGPKVRQLRLLASVVARQLHQGNEELDRAISEAVSGLAGELADLAEDLERLDIDLWTKDRTFDLSVGVRQAGQKSWTASAVTALSQKQAPAPGVFRLLPAEVTAASYYRGLPAAQTTGISATVAALIKGGLVQKGVQSARAGTFSEALLALLTSEQPGALAAGPLVLEQDGEEMVYRSAYHLWGMMRSSKDVEANFSSLARAVSSKDFQQFLADSDLRFVLRKHNGGLPGVSGATIYEWETPQSWSQALGDAGMLSSRDAAGFDKMFARGAGLLAIASVGEATWIVVGRTKERLKEGFAALQSKGEQTVAQAPELSEFLQTPGVDGGFFRLGWVVSRAAPAVSSQVAEKLRGALADTPHRGRVPVTYFVRASVGGRVETSFSVHVPPEFLTDGFALALMAGGAILQ